MQVWDGWAAKLEGKMEQQTSFKEETGLPNRVTNRVVRDAYLDISYLKQTGLCRASHQTTLTAVAQRALSDALADPLQCIAAPVDETH